MLGALSAAAVFVVSPAVAQESWYTVEPAVMWGGDEFNVLFAGTPGSFLGVGVADIDGDRAKALKLKEEHGVEVTRVEPDSPAEKAGLKVNDVVVEYNGQRVEGTEQFVRLVRETPPGRTAKLTVSRGGTVQTIAAVIGSRKAMTFTAPQGDWGGMLRGMPIPDVQIPDVPKPMMSWRSGRLGIDGESVDSQLAEYFGVKEGVLVRNVMRDSAAAKAGLKAGDVITKIDDSHVTSPREITSVLRGMRDKKTATVTLVREKREMTLTVTFDEEAPQGERLRGLSVTDRTKL
jgi:serine protease Do